MRFPKKCPIIFLILSTFLFFFCQKAAAHVFVAEGFGVEKIAEFSQITGVDFDASGRMFVWTRTGQVYLVEEDQTTTKIIDLGAEVNPIGDLGFTGFALDPNFEENGQVYLFYLLNYYYETTFGTPDYDPNFAYFGPSFSRITRYTLDVENNFRSLLPNSRKVLLGVDKTDGVAQLANAHGSGTLRFGRDGSLLASTGDGSTWEAPYAGNGPPYYNEMVQEGLSGGFIEPKEEVGSYRAQLVDNMSGKILRIDPETGDGLSSNPFYETENPRSDASRVWALGIRNGFKFDVRPATGSANISDGKPGTLFIGDVGEGQWEELNIAAEGGLNFGWPIYEGMERIAAYDTLITQNQDAPNPLFGQGDCEQEFFTFHDLLEEATIFNPELMNPCDETLAIPENIHTFKHELPTVAYPHYPYNIPTAFFASYDENGEAESIGFEASDVPNEGSPHGFCAISGGFYTGETWPEKYNLAYLMGDYVNGWIDYYQVDDFNEIQQVGRLFEDTLNITDVTYNRFDECVYFVSYTWGQSEIYKICYGLNPPPIAQIEADILYGTSPLTVQFDGSSSYDTKGEIIAYYWEFGDGTTSSEVAPAHTFTTDSNAPTPFTVKLTVYDDEQITGTTTSIISLNNTPPLAEITSIPVDYLYSLAGLNILDLRATVSDAETADEDLSYAWQAILHHDTHIHPEEIKTDIESTVTIEPVGCDGTVYFYEIRLTVTDTHGLSTTDVQNIYPDCESTPFVELGLFSGEAFRDSVSLEWFTIDEVDVVNYEIERLKTGETSWQTVKSVPALSPSSNQDYQTFDMPSENGLYAYRLRMLDSGGVVVYSGQIQVAFLPKEAFEIYPNPCTDFLKLDFGNLDAQTVVRLYDYSGKEVFVKEYSAMDTTGEVTDQISLSNLSAGLYLLVVENGGERFVERFLKTEK